VTGVGPTPDNLKITADKKITRKLDQTQRPANVFVEIIYDIGVKKS
jgi:hypothetical protein